MYHFALNFVSKTQNKIEESWIREVRNRNWEICYFSIIKRGYCIRVQPRLFPLWFLFSNLVHLIVCDSFKNSGFKISHFSRQPHFYMMFAKMIIYWIRQRTSWFSNTSTGFSRGGRCKKWNRWSWLLVQVLSSSLWARSSLQRFLAGGKLSFPLFTNSASYLW